MTANLDELKKASEHQHATLSSELLAANEKNKAWPARAASRLSPDAGAARQACGEHQRSGHGAPAERRHSPGVHRQGMRCLHSSPRPTSTQLTEAEQRVADAVSLEAEACRMKEISQQEFKASC